MPAPSQLQNIPVMLENKSEKGNIVVQSADDEHGRTFINSFMSFVIAPRKAVYFLSDGKGWYTQS